MAQVINAHARDKFLRDVGSNLKIFALIFFSLFFCLSFYYLFGNKKNLYADLRRRAMVARLAGFDIG